MLICYNINLHLNTTPLYPVGDIVDSGKNVVVAGVPDVAYSWHSIQYRWPNKEWPSELKADFEQTVENMRITPPDRFFWYKAECTPGTHMILRGVGGVPGMVVKGQSEEKLDFIEDMAAVVNHKIEEVLGGADTLPFNVLSVDFVQDEVLDHIIRMNVNKAEELVFNVPQGSPSLNLNLTEVSVTSENDVSISQADNVDSVFVENPVNPDVSVASANGRTSAGLTEASIRTQDGSLYPVSVSTAAVTEIAAHGGSIPSALSSVRASPSVTDTGPTMRSMSATPTAESVRSVSISVRSAPGSVSRSATPGSTTGRRSANGSVMSAASSVRSARGSVRSVTVAMNRSLNSTTSSVASNFDMPLRKAPAVEVKETTM